eukprot:1976909-Amphidinium_carterae.1
MMQTEAGDPDDAGSGCLPATVRVLELFAGIGGWRVALEHILPAGVTARVSAFDSQELSSKLGTLSKKTTKLRQIDIFEVEKV